MTLDNLVVTISQNRAWASQKMPGLVKPELSSQQVLQKQPATASPKSVCLRPDLLPCACRAQSCPPKPGPGLGLTPLTSQMTPAARNPNTEHWLWERKLGNTRLDYQGHTCSAHVLSNCLSTRRGPCGIESPGSVTFWKERWKERRRGEGRKGEKKEDRKDWAISSRLTHSKNSPPYMFLEILREILQTSKSSWLFLWLSQTSAWHAFPVFTISLSKMVQSVYSPRKTHYSCPEPAFF